MSKVICPICEHVLRLAAPSAQETCPVCKLAFSTERARGIWCRRRYVRLRNASIFLAVVSLLGLSAVACLLQVRTRQLRAEIAALFTLQERIHCQEVADGLRRELGQERNAADELEQSNENLSRGLARAKVDTALLRDDLRDLEADKSELETYLNSLHLVPQ